MSEITRNDREIAAKIYYGIRPNGGNAEAGWIETGNTEGLFASEIRYLGNIAAQVHDYREASAQEALEKLGRLVSLFERGIKLRGQSWDDVRDTLAMGNPDAREIVEALKDAGRMLDRLPRPRALVKP